MKGGPLGINCTNAAAAAAAAAILEVSRAAADAASEKRQCSWGQRGAVGDVAFVVHRAAQLQQVEGQLSVLFLVSYMPCSCYSSALWSVVLKPCCAKSCVAVLSI